MKTYKLGNKVNCIIRSVCAGQIGSQEILYANQPYTVVKNIEASLLFKDVDSVAKNSFSILSFSTDSLSEVRLSNVELNDKILNLIFSTRETGLISTMQSCEAEDGKIYITTNADEIYQVFIYDCNGKLEKAFNSLTEKQIEVEKNENYLVFFSYASNQSYSLKREQNMYLSLDLIIQGNTEDELSTSTIHIDKCALKVDKNLYFNRQINTIDLKFVVVDSSNNYITLE